MLQSLSPASQKVMEQAQAIARAYHVDYVDAEHVLLAILETNNTRAGQVLRDNGVTSAKFRQNVEQFFKEDPKETTVTGRLPGTIHVRNMLAHAVEIAAKRQAATVEPEHLLLALAQEQDSLALRALQTFGVDAARLEKALGTA